ncbi:MAG: NAD(P)/FAD-dependent oxidoreductase [Sphingomonadaceae bacterium]
MTDTTVPDFDVLIVGAGISGIGMAAHLEMMCPDRSYGLLERREKLGGTWDLFRYPGIRSDSDMHTLGFAFEPWTHEKSIADGPAILEYLHRIADERGIRDHIRFNSKVVSADFDVDSARWTVTLEGGDIVTANWLYLGSGYYDYDEPHDAGFGTSGFGGQVIHPQFWPEDLDYAGKKVVVIGSGATAVTIVPSMADKAAHVTMLQRTPTYYFSRPAKDGLANWLRKVLPAETAYKITRWKNVTMQDIGFKRARSKPEKVKDFLFKKIRAELGDKFDEQAFTPPYDPWDQRLCLVPDADLFRAMREGRASIATGHIDKFEERGIRLKSGELVEADIVITATGLKLAMAGKIDVSIEGEPVKFEERFYYKGAMFSNLPNLSAVFGYLNASWTLRADLVSEYTCRVLNRMAEKGADLATPVLPDDHGLEEDDIFDFSSGYIQRSKHIMPKNATAMPWRLNQEYVRDRKDMKTGAVEDGILAFGKAKVAPDAKSETLEPAE